MKKKQQEKQYLTQDKSREQEKYIIISQAHEFDREKISKFSKIEYYNIERLYERFADFSDRPTNIDENLLTICQNRAQVTRFIDEAANEDEGEIYEITEIKPSELGKILSSSQKLNITLSTLEYYLLATAAG